MNNHNPKTHPGQCKKHPYYRGLQLPKDPACTHCCQLFGHAEYTRIVNKIRAASRSQLRRM